MSTQTNSIWSEAEKFPTEPPLQREVGADVVVVGAGIAGLTCAYLLAGEGRQVRVMEAQPAAASGETHFTTAHLACVIDDRFSHVEAIHGTDALRDAVSSHRDAIAFIEATAAAEQIDCDFRRVDGYLFLYKGEGEDVLHQEGEAARRIGLPYEWTKCPFAPEKTAAALRFPGQGRFHPLKYLAGLREACLKRGVVFHGGTRVVSVEGGPMARVKTEKAGTVLAKQAVVATNTPINDWLSPHHKQAPYMTYAVALPVQTGAFPDALFWDTHDPYYYVRLQEVDGQAYLIVGGEDHKTGQHTDTEDNWRRVAEWARDHFPVTGPARWRWSGQVMETLDGLAFIGADPSGVQNVYIATGDSGMGMTHGTIAGMLLRDLLNGRDNSWARIYDPSRQPLRATPDLVSENVNVARQYLDWLTPGDKAEADIKPGEGAVVRSGLSKLAVYRDDEGKLHRHSAACPHMGCVVRWNGGEKTFDCPCHGSRFSKTGAVLHGPATKGLEPA